MNTILILGANSDIAKATAHEYANNGFNIQLACRNKSRLERFAKDLAIRSNQSVELFELDILDLSQHSVFFDSLKSMPNGVISAIGYLGEQQESHRNSDEFVRVTNTNYTAIANLLNIVAQNFSEIGSGFIVGISSVAGDRGRSSNYIYGASKAAFSAYLSGMRQSLFDKGVQVLTVKPGFVDTTMTKDIDLPEKITASPERVAKDIYNAQIKGRSVVYTMSLWFIIMSIVKSIPEFIFKRLKM